MILNLHLFFSNCELDLDRKNGLTEAKQPIDQRLAAYLFVMLNLFSQFSAVFGL